MKKYIKPAQEIIDIEMEELVLFTSKVKMNDEVLEDGDWD